MKTSIRRALVDSHISAVAVAVLLVWSIDSAAEVFGSQLGPAMDYIATAVATLSFPYSPYSFIDRSSLAITFSCAFDSVVAAAAAWLLSRWAFGIGPIRASRGYRARVLLRGNDD